jgi:tetratricopeptide (TPR) repeat protein
MPVTTTRRFIGRNLEVSRVVRDACLLRHGVRASDMRLSFDMPSSRHIPFFQVLSRCTPDSADWRATTAGLVAMRLADRRLAGRPRSWRHASRIRRAIRQVDRTSPLYPALVALFSAVNNGWRLRRHRVMTALSAYAARLSDVDEWTLAADVYSTVVAYATDDDAIKAEAYERGGEALRAIGRFDEAAQSFRDGRALALTRGDVVGELRMRIAEASVASRRGRVGEARAILDEAIGAAERAGLPHVRALALRAL